MVEQFVQVVLGGVVVHISNISISEDCVCHDGHIVHDVKNKCRIDVIVVAICIHNCGVGVVESVVSRYDVLVNCPGCKVWSDAAIGELRKSAE